MPLFPQQKSLEINKLLARGRGFTIIELLISTAIISILLGISLAAFQGFATRTQSRDAALQLKSELRKYQNFAISGQKNPDPSDTSPTRCGLTGTLENYSIVITTTTYDVTLNCAPSPPLTLTTTKPWQSTVSVDWVGRDTVDDLTNQCSNIEIRFKPTNQGVELLCNGDPAIVAQNVYVRFSQSGATYRLFVTQSGEIYEQRILF